MNALRVAIVWHMHQPIYRHGGRYHLPWVRTHATKDYLDVAESIGRVHGMRATINVSPALLTQLEDYANGRAAERQLSLISADPHRLRSEDLRELADMAFRAAESRIVPEGSRLANLRDRWFQRDPGIAVPPDWRFSDWQDLQVWSLLAWLGPLTRQKEPFDSLIRKNEGYSSQEKQTLLEATRNTIADVIPAWRRLWNNGAVELATSPFYHPILPLLIDARSTLDGLPDAELPPENILWETDARHQVEGAIRKMNSLFDRSPTGMWPSEGAVSQESLALMASSGVSWTASDQQILENSIEGSVHPQAHCFPWLCDTTSGPVVVLFRDSELSDRIGFVYSTWDQRDAASDMITRLARKRQQIVDEYDIQALDTACVSVVLDGENCWEHYENNGQGFQQSLYHQLVADERFEPVTPGELTHHEMLSSYRKLPHMKAGSWIDGNFRIWIGEREKNIAWSAVASARKTLFACRDSVDDEQFHNAYESLLIAEGSDWFWWFGPDNTSVDEPIFDVLFRENLADVYRHLGLIVPESLSSPISDHEGMAGSGGSMLPSHTGR